MPRLKIELWYRGTMWFTKKPVQPLAGRAIWYRLDKLESEDPFLDCVILILDTEQVRHIISPCGHQQSVIILIFWWIKEEKVVSLRTYTVILRGHEFMQNTILSRQYHIDVQAYAVDFYVNWGSVHLLKLLKLKFKGRVQQKLRPMLLYINQKLFSRPIIAVHKILILLKGHFTIFKKPSA